VPEAYPLSSEIAAMLPPDLLQKAKSYNANGGILPNDYETISAAYAVMLKRLNEVVPNIDASRSALCGFSNGAHTIGVLLAKQDPVILQQFHSFGMFEGGVMLPMTVGLAGQLPEPLKKHRYMIIFSDVDAPTEGKAADPFRPFFYNIFQNFSKNAKANGVDLTFVTTHSGHHFGVDEKPLVADWARKDTGGTAPR
jgi:predicted esterase